jgi:Polyketide cyclase / dehydrase and lipid transport
MSSSSDPWPPKEGLSAIIVPRSEVVFTTVASCKVQAPAAAVFEAVCDVSTYPAWNSFVPRVTIHSQPDGVPSNSQILELETSFTFHVIMDASKPDKDTPTQLRITDVSTPEKPSSYIPQEMLESDATFVKDLNTVYRIAWKTEGGFVARGLKSERFHEIVVLGDNECEVRTWENQGNFLAKTVKWLYQKTLREKFQLWCDDLKKYCEKPSFSP